MSPADRRRDRPATPGDSSRQIQPFAPRQRRALVLLLAIFIACLAVGLLLNPTVIPDPMPAEPERALVDRLDPNEADASALAALPSLGMRRAQDLVTYRDHARAGDSQRIVFRQLDDLMRVPGIGYAISRQMEPYVSFPTTRATADLQNGK